MLSFIEHIDPWVKFITAVISFLLTAGGAIAAFVSGTNINWQVVQSVGTIGTF